MKKISFSERYGLQQAVLEGRKTMTRRVDKRLNDPRIHHISEWGMDEKKAYITAIYNTGWFEDVYPLYQIGEVVAVAQRYSECAEIDDYYNCKQAKGQPGWNNKMFVKAHLMPHRIRITDIKVERLQDISDVDCLKEGLKVGTVEPKMYGFASGKHIESFLSPRQAFAALIDRICGKGTWDANPLVFAYTFELIK